jgi:hypothetical protein
MIYTLGTTLTPAKSRPYLVNTSLDELLTALLGLWCYDWAHICIWLKATVHLHSAYTYTHQQHRHESTGFWCDDWTHICICLKAPIHLHSAYTHTHTRQQHRYDFRPLV